MDISFRVNPVTGQAVSLSPSRRERPIFDFSSDERKDCPFCPKNSHLVTEPFVSSPDGKIRILANKYPILDEESPEGFGYHDVIIDTDNHLERLHEFPIEHIVSLFKVIRKRALDLFDDSRIELIQVFKNQGEMAGASITHSHWQMVAMPEIPALPSQMFSRQRTYFESTGHCLICDQITSSNELCFYENEGFVALSPFAPRFPMEIHIAPKAHRTSFFELTENELYSLADAIKTAISALLSAYKNPDYNLCFYNGMYRQNEPSAHFYLGIIPRKGKIGGFEFSTDCYVHSAMPEETAERLKEYIKASN